MLQKNKDIRAVNQKVNVLKDVINEICYVFKAISTYI